MAVGLAVIGWLFSPDANAQWGWNNFWPHRVHETIRTDAFKGEIASITNATMTVKGNQVVKHRVRWSYAAIPPATIAAPSTSTSTADAHDAVAVSDEEQTFRIAPSCRIFSATGDRLLPDKLQVGGLVSISYAVQAKGDRVAAEITVSNLKP
jgi:hypothetical protein